MPSQQPAKKHAGASPAARCKEIIRHYLGLYAVHVAGVPSALGCCATSSAALGQGDVFLRAIGNCQRLATRGRLGVCLGAPRSPDATPRRKVVCLASDLPSSVFGCPVRRASARCLLGPSLAPSRLTSPSPGADFSPPVRAVNRGGRLASAWRATAASSARRGDVLLGGAAAQPPASRHGGPVTHAATPSCSRSP